MLAACQKPCAASTLTLVRFSEGVGEVLLCSHEKKREIITHSNVALAVISGDLDGGANRNMGQDEKQTLLLSSRDSEKNHHDSGLCYFRMQI